MDKLKIGIIREGKVPTDKRVALPPSHARKVQEMFPHVEVVAQKSEIRCYNDDEYRQAGIRVVDSLDECDVVIGVKEVPVSDLCAEKTYFFFSHTIKKQEYNRGLLREVIRKNITLVDYETITDQSGKRVIAFGRWAGIVGAYNGVWAYGQRYNLFDTRRACDCFDLEDLKSELAKIDLPPVKILLTGGGRVAKGAIEVLTGIGVRRVTPRQFREDYFDFPVFALLNARDYNLRKDGGEFSRTTFYGSPQQFESNFLQYSSAADLLIASAYWDPKAPALFERKDIMSDDFKIAVIADITCDIDGSIPSTKQASTIDEPLYDYNPCDDRVEPPLTDEGNITVMAVDNLPCELARDASESFGTMLLSNVLPELITGDKNGIIERATIARGGKLNERYTYLQDYVDGN
ncbi:NAD(P)-dependent oxidoreductase [Desulfosediminicola sp.]|uniref:NAD(P)-dependent oxidoreductase n=1 Tax=Desulfosediminicola sp. TaxID=2886825 RepID=UPI003AF2D5C7